jgi:hypothetical protein
MLLPRRSRAWWLTAGVIEPVATPAGRPPIEIRSSGGSGGPVRVNRRPVGNLPLPPHSLGQSLQKKTLHVPILQRSLSTASDAPSKASPPPVRPIPHLTLPPRNHSACPDGPTRPASPGSGPRPRWTAAGGSLDPTPRAGPEPALGPRSIEPDAHVLRIPMPLQPDSTRVGPAPWVHRTAFEVPRSSCRSSTRSPGRQDRI